MTYEQAVAEHRWEVPERYNIAADVCDKHPPDKPAMVWEDFRGNRRDLEYDFVVAPGASPDRISLAFDDAIAIDDSGDLVVRTAGGAVTSLARTAAGAIGPAVAGFLMQHAAMAGPIVAGGSIKIVYDVALYRSFRHVRPVEEPVEVSPA